VKSALLACLGQDNKSAWGRLTDERNMRRRFQMGTSLNVSVVGFVGSDPQVRTVQTSNGEQQVASFSVADSG
jgi:hypothetical protein